MFGWDGNQTIRSFYLESNPFMLLSELLKSCMTQLQVDNIQYCGPCVSTHLPHSLGVGTGFVGMITSQSGHFPGNPSLRLIDASG